MRRRISSLSLFVALGALAGVIWPGCGEEAPAPAATEETAPEPEDDAEAALEPEEEGPPPGVDHTIGEGQTLWAIARAYGVSVADIMEANELRPRDVRRLRAGETLRIPGAEAAVTVEDAPAEPEELPPVEDGAYHRLANGETLWDVARLYEVGMDAIMERNEFDDDAVRLLRPGQAIVVPGVTERQVERATEDREATLAASRATRGFRHTVTEGETIWDLASSFGVTTNEIMAANGLNEEGVRNLRAARGSGSRAWSRTRAGACAAP